MLLHNNNNNPFRLLKPPSEKRFREAVVQIILSTDPRQHSDHTQAYREFVAVGLDIKYNNDHRVCICTLQ